MNGILVVLSCVETKVGILKFKKMFCLTFELKVLESALLFLFLGIDLNANRLHSMD